MTIIKVVTITGAIELASQFVAASLLMRINLPQDLITVVILEYDSITMLSLVIIPTDSISTRLAKEHLVTTEVTLLMVHTKCI